MIYIITYVNIGIMSEDFLNGLGELALASRLKRLSEKMMVDAKDVYRHFDVKAQPKWFPIFALLNEKKKVSVVQAAKLLRLSQPAISQFCKQLEAKSLVSIVVSNEDSRKKYISLSKKGEVEVEKMRLMWNAVGKAAKQLCEQDDNDFFKSLLTFENALNEHSLLDRIMDNSIVKNNLSILEYTPELAHYFDSINREWIQSMFVVESIDDEVLKDPQRYIIDRGGYIWFIKHETFGIVGTCALLNKGKGYFELTKMGVRTEHHGLKIGETLLQHVLEFCLKSSISNVYLLTSKKCQAAIHLYEKLGFTHSPCIMKKFGASYQRCDVAMKFQKR